MDSDTIIFNSCALLAGVFVLQHGTDLFIRNTAILARRLGISKILISLFTTGAEWEELAVVIASVVQHRSSLGLGNIIGSSIANILGAFSLGLLFHRESTHGEAMRFDLSAKIYAVALLGVTSSFTILALTDNLDFTTGIFFLVGFGVYVFSIGSAIYEGFFFTLEEAQEGEDAHADEEEDLCSSVPPIETESQQLAISIFPSTIQVHETSPLLADGLEFASSTERLTRGVEHVVLYHIFLMAMGFIALSISGYVLSHTASTLASTLNLPGSFLGITVLSIATTLPEKILSLLAGYQRHGGTLVVKTAGSNIFLLTLCLGIVFLVGIKGDETEDIARSLAAFEVWTAWACSLAMVTIVWAGGKRWMGALLLGCYGAFIGTELFVFRG